MKNTLKRKVILLKSYVKGYSKKDGTYVAPHNREDNSPRSSRQEAKKPKKPVVHHPRTDDNGAPVAVKHPSRPSAASTWHNPDAVATFVPDGDSPMSLGGIPFTPWRDHPRTAEGWDYVDGVMDDLDEPPFHNPNNKTVSSGVIIEEADGRIWMTAPTNEFGGYKASFPKGTADDGVSLQAGAIREAFEETGLKVEITGFIGDFERTTSAVRMYRAKRVGGTPTDCGWESQAIHLAPKGRMYDHLNMWTDHLIAEKVGAGPAPKKPEVKKNYNKFLF